MSQEDPAGELERLLDDVTYDITTARSAGLTDVDSLRGALKRAKQRIDAADALAGDVAVKRRRSEDE